MTEIEAAHLVAILAAAFPSANVDGRTVEIYVEHLKDLEYDSGRVAVECIVRTADWFPSVAAIRKEILSVTGSLSPTREEAWYEVESNMRLKGRTGKCEWSHPVIAESVKSMGWVNMCLSENIDVIRGQFFKVYDAISQRADRARQAESSLMVGPAVQSIELESVVREA